MDNDEVLARLEQLEDEVRQLRATAGGAPPSDDEAPVSRRALLRLGGAAAVGAAATVLSSRAAAAAPSADGDVKLGGTFADNNAGSAMTQVQTNLASDPNFTGRAALYGFNTNSGQGVIGQSAGQRGIGVWGLAQGAAGYGVFGVADGADGIGVVASGNGAPLQLVPNGTLSAAPISGTHARGELSVSGFGELFYCIQPGSPGTWRQVMLAGEVNRAGVDGTILGASTAAPVLLVSQGGASTNGPAIEVVGQTAGLKASANSGPAIVAEGTRQLRLVPQSGAGPTGGTHERGEFLVDSTGGLLQCKTAGLPGTWTRVGYNPLPTPFRLIDTRTANAPLGAGERRQLTIAPSGTAPNTVPGGGAVNAVMLNVTAVPAPGQTSSYFTVLPNDAPAFTPATGAPYSNVNWVSGQVQANLVTVRVPANGLIDVYNHNGNVHLIVDVLGFYS